MLTVPDYTHYLIIPLKKKEHVNKPLHPLCSHTVWFSSLNTLTQAVLETAAPLLSDWPAWHSKGASSSSWAFSI